MSGTLLEAPSSSAPPSTLALPSPKLFDILVRLNELLHRVLADVPTADGPPQNTQVNPMAIKDFATEVLRVKNGINDAKRELRGLPDAERTLAQQQAEIRKLESLIEKRREMLRKVAEMAGRRTERNGEETVKDEEMTG